MTDHTRGRDFSAYLDGALSTRRSARLERHVQGCARCRSDLDSLRMAKRAVAGLAEVESSRAWLPQHEGSPLAAAIAGSPGSAPERPAVPRGRSSRAISRSRRALVGALAMASIGSAALGLGAWLVPPPTATVTYRQEVRQHLVLINDPLSDQISYLLEARHR